MVNIKTYSSERITLRYEKPGYCRCCGHRLTFKERCKRQWNGKVICSKCGVSNYGRKFIMY